MAVECFHTLKGYHLGIGDIRATWYWDGKVWRRMQREDYDAEWYCEDYEMGVAETSDMLANLCEYLRGVKEYDDYGDFSITFDMGGVEAAGWDEARLVNTLEIMANALNRRQILKAQGEPYLYETTDDWGAKHTYWRHPALVPLGGMLHKDYPEEIQPTGDRRP